ncbi:spore germination protein, partial [Mesorhizobium sp. M00.F.Ca.ET.186.01.1.1]
MTTVTEKRRPISERIEENKEYLDDRLGVGKSFDIGVHEFFVGNTKLLMYYINGFAESMLVSQIMREINDLRGRDITDSLFETLFYKFIPFYQLAKVDTTDEFMDKLLVGQVGLILDRSNHAIIMDTKILPTRSPQEPDTERIVR